jgi:hypothetical protein
VGYPISKEGVGCKMDIEEIIKSMEASITDEDREALADIKDKVFNALRYGFNSEALKILDNEKVTPGEIESIKDKLQQGIVLRLYGIGNSVYYGRFRRGNISSFLEVVMRLGTDHTKACIIAFTLLELATSVHTKKHLAKSMATSVMAKILANKFGFSNNSMNMAELAGMILEIGKTIVLIYQEKEKENRLTDDFSDRFNAYLGLKIIKHFNLPDYLNSILLEDTVSFDGESFSISAVVNIAQLMVSHSFNVKGKLSLKIPPPDRDGVYVNHYGEIIQGLFRAIGLNEYIEIIEALTEA